MLHVNSALAEGSWGGHGAEMTVPAQPLAAEPALNTPESRRTGEDTGRPGRHLLPVPSISCPGRCLFWDFVILSIRFH